MNRALAGAVAALVAGCASGAGAPQAVEPQTVALRPYVGQLVTVEVDAGAGPSPMLFDTGASITALTPQAAEAAGCTPFGRLVGWRMSSERVELQRCGVRKLKIADYETAHEIFIFDLGTALPKELPPVGGFLSLASFSDRLFTLDLADRRLTLETKSSLEERIKNATPVTMRLVRGYGGDDISVLVRIEAATGDLWFLLDSGNLDVVIVAPHAPAQLGLEIENEDTRSGEVAFPLQFTIDGIGRIEAPARLKDIIYDGALSEEVMARFEITFDLANERLWFAPKSVRMAPLVDRP